MKALARAWRWQRLIDDGVYSSVTEISEAEEINKRYISRSCGLHYWRPTSSRQSGGTSQPASDAGEAGAATAGELGRAA